MIEEVWIVKYDTPESLQDKEIVLVCVHKDFAEWFAKNAQEDNMIVEQHCVDHTMFRD